jgi:exonuclease VII large subunit
MRNQARSGLSAPQAVPSATRCAGVVSGPLGAAAGDVAPVYARGVTPRAAIVWIRTTVLNLVATEEE